MSDFLERIRRLSPKRLELLALELHEQLEARSTSEPEPIAIIGMGCRFPGGADSPDAFWRLLTEGVDAIREVPSDRWDIDALYDPDPEAPGRMSTRWGGFLDRIDLFDAPFFGISPREARSLDPQQRLLLEVVWETLENAAQAPDRLEESPTGMFVGIANSEYGNLLLRRSLEEHDAYLASGNSHAVASGRISYLLGLHGPSLSVDTACSSSLVAVHLACRSLRAGECRLALAAGVNAVCSPETTISLSKAHMMAADGRCKTFDAAADGFVRSEGCGVVALKRLADARADGDAVLAVIRGSALNQDGRSSGLTAPNGPSQEKAIRAALADARLSPADVGYVETHGTGTSLGDPIEVRALGAVMGEGRAADRPLMIGSVKTNLGHLEAAAGIAGLIKTVLMLRRRAVPPHLHLERLNPHVDWDALPLTIPTRMTPWREESGKLIAGVSSFGFSGTNAHVVLEAAPESEPAANEIERPLHLLALSARDEAALDEWAERCGEALKRDEIGAVADVCFTANAGRAQFEHRLAIVAAARGELQAKLEVIGRKASAEGVARSGGPASKKPQVVFLFTGQGAQYVDMGRGLFETQPTFRRALLRCDEILDPLLGQSLVSLLYPDADETESAARLLDQTCFTQPALFAVEYALAELWRSWGIEPAAVMGHSVGEYVAACVAGVFSLEDGLRLIAERARLMQARPAGGAMAAVFAGENRIQSAIEPFLDRLSIAAVNGPENIVVSGEAEALDQVLRELASGGVQSRPLRVSHAFHSPLMEPMLESLERAAATIDMKPPRIGLVSNLSGRFVQPEEIVRPDYWRRHAREAVRFADTMAMLCAEGFDAFLEIGPQPVLLGMGMRCIPDEPCAWLSSLRRGREDWAEMLGSLAALYVAGAPVDWPGFDRDYARRKVALPTYPFQRARHWIDVPQIKGTRRAQDVASLPDETASPDELPADWFYDVAWRSVGSLDFAESDLSPPQLAEQLQPRLVALARERGLDAYARLTPELDRVCRGLIARAFADSGFAWTPGETLSDGDLCERLGVEPKYERLLRRMCRILESGGAIGREGEGWRVVASPDEMDAGEACASLAEKFPDFATEIELTRSFGSRLAALLRGDDDPLDLLFPGGSLEVLERIYRDSPYGQTYNLLLRDAVSRIIAQHRSDRPFRILEIGAGVGATTAHALEALPSGRFVYAFTDLSELFLERARRKFGVRPEVEFMLFDVERDPASQGLEPGRYDLVIAANVLHATSDLRRTLGHARRLLAPGGRMALLEGTRPESWVDLTFGLTEGWWHFTDADLRPDYPLLGETAWLELLRETGFGEVGLLPSVDVAHESVPPGQALFLAQVETEKASGNDADAEGWLIFADRADEGEIFFRAFLGRENAGAEASLAQSTLVHPGDAYNEETREGGGFGRRISVNPESPDDFDKLVASTVASAPTARRGAIFLWPLSCEDRAPASEDALRQRQMRLCGGAAFLVRALARGGVRDFPVWIATAGGQSLRDADALDPDQATLWGLGRAIALEHPELWGGLIDLDPEAEPERQSRELRSALNLARAKQEDQLACRGGEAFAPRLTRTDPPAPAEVPIREDGAYLIVGGLGGLGLVAARWLAGRGARRLILTGRKGLPERGDWAKFEGNSEIARRIRAVREIEETGVSVTVAAADVADRDAMARLFSDVRKGGVPLRGVIHAAAAMSASPIREMEPARLWSMLRVKTAGARWLDEFTRDLDLDFFILFSSTTALLGVKDLGHYAAANRFLDLFVRERTRRGLPSLSINWGTWEEMRLASGDQRRTFAAGGLRPMPSEAALRAMSRLAASDHAGAIVASVDWATLKSLYETRGTFLLLAELGWQQPAGAAEPQSGPKASAPAAYDLDGLSPDEQRERLFECVRGEAAAVLGAAVDAIDPEKGLFELGMDSLMSVELKSRLERAVNRKLPSTLTFNYPTVTALVDYLSREIPSSDGKSGIQKPATEKTAAMPTEDAEASVEAASEEALAARLEEKLKRWE